MLKETYIQVGVTALRDPIGKFLPSVPLYIKVDTSKNEDGLNETEENLMRDISGLFANKYNEYMWAKRKAKI